MRFHGTMMVPASLSRGQRRRVRWRARRRCRDDTDHAGLRSWPDQCRAEEHPMAEHDLTVTAELRQTFTAEGTKQCEALGLDPATVQPWEDGFRTAGEATAFEWWYFDVQADDGSNIVVTFSTKPHTASAGPLQPQVLVIHRTAAGETTKHLVTYPAEELQAASGRDVTCDVRIGPNTVVGDLKTYHVHVAVEDLVLDLRIDSESPSWRPMAGYSYFDKQQTTYFAWVVAVPYGRASGSLTTAGADPVAISGSAYHDHNWGNTPMGDGLDHWYWGRARVGDYSLIYVQLTTPKPLGLGGLHFPVWFVAKGDDIVTDDGLSMTLAVDDVVDGPQGQTYPKRLVWTWRRDATNDPDGDPAGYGEITLTVTDVKLIEVLDQTADMPTWKRRLVHVFRNPLYYDFDAHAELRVDLRDRHETVTGRTLFEKMMFR
jgi:hypothetical protein